MKARVFQPKPCAACAREYVPTSSRQALCEKCREAGAKPVGEKPSPAAAPSGRLGAGTAKELVASLVQAAEGLGAVKALTCVEAATREVLRRSQIMRDALIRSRHENAKLRTELEVAAVGEKEAARADD